MERMNFSPEAVNHLRQMGMHYTRSGMACGALVTELAQSIDAAPKFMLPEYGQILDFKGKELTSIAAHYIKRFRLPYPVTVLEYLHRKEQWGTGAGLEYDAVVVLAVEREMDDDRYGIEVYPVSRTLINGRRVWCPTSFCARVEWDGNSLIGGINTVTKEGDDLIQKLGMDEAMKHAKADTANECSAVIQLIAALSCSNVLERDLPAPERLNKKRKAAGKMPLYAYKVLEIGTATIGKKATASASVASSIRSHLRRGHIRRLPSGTTTWVQACVVGHVRNGIVHKDYRIAKEHTQPQ